MKKSVLEKLNTWASLNNWSIPHPLDDARFWDFVIEAYKSGDTNISDDDFYEAVSKHYEEEDALTESYIKYQNGIELLRRYEGNV